MKQDTPAPQHVISNWTEYPGPRRTKARLAARNFWRRFVLRSNCCGNHGQPGC